MKKIWIMTAFVATSLFLWGCGEQSSGESGNIEVTPVTGTPSEEKTDEVQDTDNSESDLVVEETVTDEKGNKKEEGVSFSFEDLEDLEFYYSSGAGAWQTVLMIYEDGSFSGEYSDSEMGSTGEGYPNGMCYRCSFEGIFTEPVKINDYTYSAHIEEMGYNQEPGTEEIIDGIRYIYTEANGMADAENIYIYLPESPYEKLPEEYQSWVWYARENQEAEQLSFYGLYNEKSGAGFSSYKTSYRIDDLMTATKEWSDTLKASLYNDPLTQVEMNQTSQELYATWDSALNTLWKELKEQLPEEEFQELLKEQRQWIKDKEAAMDEAGNEVKGGSMEPLVRNDVGAEYTEKRVYELYEIYKSLQ